MFQMNYNKNHNKMFASNVILNNSAALFIAIVITITTIITMMTGCNRQDKAMPARIPEVSVITVHTESVSLSTELPGRTEAFKIADIRPQVSGLILKRAFKEGSNVKKGELLYQIDPAPFKAELNNNCATLLTAKKDADRAKAALAASLANVAKQKATLELARRNRKRFEEAYKARAVSAAQRDQAVTEEQVALATLNAYKAQVESDRKAIAAAEAAIKQAEAAVEIARINLGYTRIIAPISGRIGKSNVTEGAIVTAYQPMALATIQQLDPIYVNVPQSTAEMLKLKRRLESGYIQPNKSEKHKVKLILEDGSVYPLDGTLEFRDVTVDPTTGSVILRMIFPNPDMILLPGMFVRAVIKEGIKQDAILVPQQAVLRTHKGMPFVLIVDKDNKVSVRIIGTERAIGSKWLVNFGLKPGDRVIVEGLQFIRPGMTVRISSEKSNLNKRVDANNRLGNEKRLDVDKRLDEHKRVGKDKRLSKEKQLSGDKRVGRNRRLSGNNNQSIEHINSNNRKEKGQSK